MDGVEGFFTGVVCRECDLGVVDVRDPKLARVCRGLTLAKLGLPVSEATVATRCGVEGFGGDDWTCS